MLVQNIKTYGKAKGLTLSEIERQAGLGCNTISRWDTSLPSYDKVVRVAQLLGVTVEQLTA